jgi:DNA-binding NarL/FixJ family response regulator
VSHSLKLLLGAEPDLLLVGEAGDCRAALETMPAGLPEVVIIDVDCPEFERPQHREALETIAALSPVILLTLRDSARIDRLAHGLGAAVVVKSEPANALLAAIRKAARDE